MPRSISKKKPISGVIATSEDDSEEEIPMPVITPKKKLAEGKITVKEDIPPKKIIAGITSGGRKIIVKKPFTPSSSESEEEPSPKVSIKKPVKGVIFPIRKPS